ncbi:MAG: TolC family protein [Candidatus Omnitrophica bacterium]|nr:TolC family protein [Candidatus Omnitrophota bacterium]
MIKRILAVIMMCALALGYNPTYVLSESDSASLAAHKTSAKARPKNNDLAPAVHESGSLPVQLSQVRPALTLSDCYQMSLVQSEIIAISADLIKVTEAHFLQALSIGLPHVSFQSSDFQQADATIEDTGGGASSASASLKNSTRNFNATQTLFNGFKAIAAMRGSKYERSQRTEEKTRAEQLLLVDVSNAFYLLIEKRQDIKVLIMTRDALANRVKELRDRADIGKSRPSEIVNAKAQFYSVEAALEVSRSQEVIARQLLEFLVGQPVGEVVDMYRFPSRLLSESYYVAKADYRPDVAAAKYAWQLKKEGILVADSGFLPEVNFETNYYTQRTGFDKGTDWDIMLTVDVPIFDGGLTLGNSKEANLQADQAALLFHRTKRLAPYDIKNTYVTLKTAMAVCDALRKTYTTAKLNYHLQRKDYMRNLVNNLDVLASIQTLQDSERNYIHALYEAKRQYWQLRVAIGQSGTESLNDAF